MTIFNQSYQYIDLTHPLTNDIPTWDLSCGFQCKITHDYPDSHEATLFRIQTIVSPLGVGTHMDAPAHCFPQAKTIEQIDLNTLITQCYVIDVAKQSHEDFSINALEIKKFIEVHGAIAENSLVIFHTGWGKFWQQPHRYHNEYRFPYLQSDAAEMLLEYNIAGLGIDTLSPDRKDSDFPVHRLMLGAGKYIIENVAHADKMPSIGGYSIALPMSIADATEAPIRLVGIVKN